MFDLMPDDLPDDPAERAVTLQNLLISRATGGVANSTIYSLLRREFMADSDAARLLPRFVRTCRDLNAFWSEAKAMSDTYEGRRVQIRSDFQPLLDRLEGRSQAPLDAGTTEALTAFNAEGVANVWRKALDRRQKDPEGAITAARTLLETVCKHILHEAGETWAEADDLPILYRKLAKVLRLAPDDHTEQVFKQILGSCQSVVESLGALRNKLSDAHSPGPKRARPLPRHAELAVNLSGTMATFLVATWDARRREAAE